MPSRALSLFSINFHLFKTAIGLSSLKLAVSEFMRVLIKVSRNQVVHWGPVAV